MRALFVFLVSLAAVACIVPGTHAVVVVPGGPAASGPITAMDAERIALRVAAEHGYSSARAEKSHHDEGQGGRWKVEVRGIADGKDSKIDVRLDDAGKVIDVKDHRKGGKHDEGDEDDNGDHGKGKKDK